MRGKDNMSPGEGWHDDIGVDINQLSPELREVVTVENVLGAPPPLYKDGGQLVNPHPRANHKVWKIAAGTVAAGVAAAALALYLSKHYPGFKGGDSTD